METIMKLKIETIDDLKGFVMSANKHKGDVLVKKGLYTVEGKSLMGMLSLDLSEPFVVEFAGELPSELAEEFIRYQRWGNNEKT